MNREEKTAKKYLESLSNGEPKFEPDGNTPPDFSLASTIGIEVRRLNENYFDTDNTKGLEELSISLHKKFREVLSSFDPKFDGASFLVAMAFKRPLPDGLKKAGEDMSKVLYNFLKGTRTTPCTLQANQSISLDVFPYRSVTNRVFLNPGSSDDNSGGLVVDLYAQNISHCIQEKTQKISAYKNRYNEWWLLLVDTIGAWNLMLDEVQQVRARIPSIGSFDKLILIDYLGNKCLLEIL